MFTSLWIQICACASSNALQSYEILKATYRVLSSFIDFYRVVGLGSCKNLVICEKMRKFAL